MQQSKVEWTFEAHVTSCCPRGMSCVAPLSSQADDCVTFRGRAQKDKLQATCTQPGFFFCFVFFSYLCWWPPRGSARCTGHFVFVTSTFLASCWFYASPDNHTVFTHTHWHMLLNTPGPAVKVTQTHVLILALKSKILVQTFFPLISSTCKPQIIHKPRAKKKSSDN